MYQKDKKKQNHLRFHIASLISLNCIATLNQFERAFDFGSTWLKLFLCMETILQFVGKMNKINNRYLNCRAVNDFLGCIQRSASFCNAIWIWMNLASANK